MPQAGLKLFFYHSQLDWHHPDYFPRGRTGQRRRPSGARQAGPVISTTWTRSCASCSPTTATIAGIWFDGWWDRPDADWRSTETYALIHQLQPAGARRREPSPPAANPGEDFQMFEKDLPGGQTAELQRATRRSASCRSRRARP